MRLTENGVGREIEIRKYTRMSMILDKITSERRKKENLVRRRRR
jgi:hypothetical protein